MADHDNRELPAGCKVRQITLGESIDLDALVASDHNSPIAVLVERAAPGAIQYPARYNSILDMPHDKGEDLWVAFQDANPRFFQKLRRYYLEAAKAGEHLQQGSPASS